MRRRAALRHEALADRHPRGQALVWHGGMLSGGSGHARRRGEITPRDQLDEGFQVGRQGWAAISLVGLGLMGWRGTLVSIRLDRIERWRIAVA